MGLIIYGILCLLGFLRRKSKILTFAMLSIMWIIYSLNTYTGDYYNYEHVYNSILNGYLFHEFEPLYTILMIIFRSLGFSFTQFRMVLGTIFIILLYKTIKCYTDSVPFVLSIYMVFPFLFFVSVLRAGIASLIIAYSIKYLIKPDRRSTLKFIILIFLAATIHFTSLFYLSLLLARKGKLKRRKLMVIFILLAVLCVLYYSDTFYYIGQMVTDNYRLIKWFTPHAFDGTVQKIKWIIYEFVILAANIVIMKLTVRALDRCQIKNERTERFVILAYNMNILLVLTVPMLILSNVFMRWVWEILLINICALVSVADLYNQSRNRGKPWYVVHVFRLAVLLICWTGMMYLYADRPYVGTVNEGIKVFENNLLFENIKYE